MSPRRVNPKVGFCFVLFILESGSANLFANGCNMTYMLEQFDLKLLGIYAA
jgi:hypothetical protein